MGTKENEREKEMSEEVKKLVIARLNVLPEGKKISLGSHGDFTKSELIERVERGDEVGQKITEIELTYLRALKDGTLLGGILTAEGQDYE